jgi:hypothetical protein
MGMSMMGNGVEGCNKGMVFLIFVSITFLRESPLFENGKYSRDLKHSKLTNSFNHQSQFPNTIPVTHQKN